MNSSHRAWMPKTWQNVVDQGTWFRNMVVSAILDVHVDCDVGIARQRTDASCASADGDTCLLSAMCAQVSMAWCCPSRVSLFTGRHVHNSNITSSAKPTGEQCRCTDLPTSLL